MVERGGTEGSGCDEIDREEAEGGSAGDGEEGSLRSPGCFRGSTTGLGRGMDHTAATGILFIGGEGRFPCAPEDKIDSGGAIVAQGRGGRLAELGEHGTASGRATTTLGESWRARRGWTVPT